MQMADYFARQLAVQEIGLSGLRRIQSAVVAIVGAGGVGSAAAACLASLGIGQMSLIDQDVVEETNLHRLSLICSEDLYTAKAEALARRLNARYPWSKTRPNVETLRQENVTELLEGADVVLDGTDNLRTRYVLNRHCTKNRVPYLFTSAIANQGHLSIFRPPSTPCLECMIRPLAAEPSESCEASGVTPTTVGLIGNLAANEAAKLLLGLPSKIHGCLLTVDLLGPEFIISRIAKNEECAVCANPPTVGEASRRIRILCSDGVANILPEQEMSLDLESLSAKIAEEIVLARSGSVFVYQKQTNRVSVFKTGRLLINNVSTEDAAIQVANEVWKQILQ